MAGFSPPQNFCLNSLQALRVLWSSSKTDEARLRVCSTASNILQKADANDSCGGTSTMVHHLRWILQAALMEALRCTPQQSSDIDQMRKTKYLDHAQQFTAHMRKTSSDQLAERFVGAVQTSIQKALS